MDNKPPITNGQIIGFIITVFVLIGLVAWACAAEPSDGPRYVPGSSVTSSTE